MATLNNPLVLGAKVSLATFAALVGCKATGNPDGVSAAFVAVVCTTPTVLSGLQRAVTQFLGSIIGGVVASVFALLGVPTLIGLPLSVGIAVGAIFPLGQGHAYAVAAFTAIYMHLLPKGDPSDTLWVRIAAVAIGGAAAALVNVAMSAAFYGRIFRRRMDLTTQALAQHLSDVAVGEGSADSLLPVFPMLRELAGEVATARHELRWRKSRRVERMEQAGAAVQALSRVAHFGRDLALAVEEAGVELTDKDVALLHYVAARLRHGSAPRPAPEGEIGDRLLAALDRWESAR